MRSTDCRRASSVPQMCTRGSAPAGRCTDDAAHQRGEEERVFAGASMSAGARRRRSGRTASRQAPRRRSPPQARRRRPRRRAAATPSASSSNALASAAEHRAVATKRVRRPAPRARPARRSARRIASRRRPRRDGVAFGLLASRAAAQRRRQAGDTAGHTMSAEQRDLERARRAPAYGPGHAERGERMLGERRSSTASPPSAAASARRRANTPAGSRSSGAPAESSTARPQRSSSAATRRATVRSGVTSATLVFRPLQRLAHGKRDRRSPPPARSAPTIRSTPASASPRDRRRRRTQRVRRSRPGAAPPREARARAGGRAPRRDRRTSPRPTPIAAMQLLQPELRMAVCGRRRCAVLADRRPAAVVQVTVEAGQHHGAVGQPGDRLEQFRRRGNGAGGPGGDDRTRRRLRGKRGGPRADQFVAARGGVERGRCSARYAGHCVGDDLEEVERDAEVCGVVVGDQRADRVPRDARRSPCRRARRARSAARRVGVGGRRRHAQRLVRGERQQLAADLPAPRQRQPRQRQPPRERRDRGRQHQPLGGGLGDAGIEQVLLLVDVADRPDGGRIAASAETLGQAHRGRRAPRAGSAEHGRAGERQRIVGGKRRKVAGEQRVGEHRSGTARRRGS